ncbi:MAG: hypothetical protein IT422_00110 [Pirellulaceae bacterium]|jgi:uncharacterized membrane protein YadS|nr:hypothetical protein [Pirellulaceae bacterium]
MKHQLKKKPLSPEVRWQRGLLAFFALVFLGLGGVLHAMPSSDSSSKFAAGTLLKVGVVLGLAWISAPQLERLGWQRLRGTLLVAVIVVILLYAIRPRIGAIAAAILIVGSAGFSLLGWFRRLTQPPP